MEQQRRRDPVRGTGATEDRWDRDRKRHSFQPGQLQTGFRFLDQTASSDGSTLESLHFPSKSNQACMAHRRVWSNSEVMPAVARNAQIFACCLSPQKHFGTSYSPLLEDLFSTVTMLRVIAGAVIMATSFTLMGCGGCNQDALTSCAQTYNSDPTISAGTDAVCKTWQTYTSCVKDAACCDFDIESDGTTKAWKDYLDSLLTMKDSLCTGSNAVSNQCS